MDESTTDEEFEAMCDRHPEAMGSAEPKPECGDGMASFAEEDLEEDLHSFCGDKLLWETTVVPFISIGNCKASDGQPKSSALIRGFKISGSEETLWAGLIFSRESCQGSFKVGVGQSAQEKFAHCLEGAPHHAPQNPPMIENNHSDFIESLRYRDQSKRAQLKATRGPRPQHPGKWVDVDAATQATLAVRHE